MTIYADVIWFLNLCIDYLLLALTAIVLKRPFNHVRMIIGALFASLIVFFLFTPFASLFYQPLMKGLYSAVIVFIAFGYKRMSYFLQGLLMFYFVTMMTGGGLFALHFFWKTEVDLLQGMTATSKGYFGSGISWIVVIIGFPLVFWFAKKRFETIEWKKVQYDQLVDIDISIAGYTFRTRGLIDSGNQLTDPLTKKPVMIIEASLLQTFFKKESIHHIMTFHQDYSEDHVDERLLDRASIIPYQVIGQSSPFLSGLRPDSVVIYYLNRRYETTNVILGLQDRELSPDGAFKSIVHPKLVLGTSTEQLA
ncbi:sigma-E processing peptidase SpoIIGA [bacterium LRH843]|nr:sigma-E processing peptidase SpoIIGA [bacterium LRH843]